MANFCLANRQRLLANIGWDSLMIPHSVSLRRRALWTWSRSAFCHVPLRPGRIKSKQIYPPFFLQVYSPSLLQGEMPSWQEHSVSLPSRKWSAVCRTAGSVLLFCWTGVLACHFSFRSQGAVAGLRASPSIAQRGGMETCAVDFWLTELGLSLACIQ